MILEPEPELESKTLDAWSQNRGLKFQFHFRSPALGY